MAAFLGRGWRWRVAAPSRVGLERFFLAAGWRERCTAGAPSRFDTVLAGATGFSASGSWCLDSGAAWRCPQRAVDSARARAPVSQAGALRGLRARAAARRVMAAGGSRVARGDPRGGRLAGCPGCCAVATPARNRAAPAPLETTLRARPAVQSLARARGSLWACSSGAAARACACLAPEGRWTAARRSCARRLSRLWQGSGTPLGGITCGFGWRRGRRGRAGCGG